MQVNGSGSFDPQQMALNYSWTTNCPNGSFNDPAAVSPILSFTPYNAQSGQPVSCSVQLMVDNEYTGASCQALVTVNGCQVDCLGKLNGNATFDRCGVCNGDGTSCLGCEDVDVTNLLFILDGNANAQAKLVNRIAKLVLNNKRAKSSSKKIAKRAMNDANTLYLQSWSLVWEGVPHLFTNCVNTEFCVQVDETASLAAYKTNSETLRLVLNKVVKELRKVNGDKKLGGSALRKGEKLHKDNLSSAAQIPQSSSVCVNTPS